MSRRCPKCSRRLAPPRAVRPVRRPPRRITPHRRTTRAKRTRPAGGPAAPTRPGRASRARRPGRPGRRRPPAPGPDARRPAALHPDRLRAARGGRASACWACRSNAVGRHPPAAHRPGRHSRAARRHFRVRPAAGPGRADRRQRRLAAAGRGGGHRRGGDRVRRGGQRGAAPGRVLRCCTTGWSPRRAAASIRRCSTATWPGWWPTSRSSGWPAARSGGRPSGSPSASTR